MFISDGPHGYHNEIKFFFIDMAMAILGDTIIFLTLFSNDFKSEQTKS